MTSFKEQQVQLIGEVPTSWKDCVLLMERAGRVCYRSEAQITDESAEPFVRRIFRAGHKSVLRFSNLVVKTGGSCVFPVWKYLETYRKDNDGDVYIGGNYQAWYEWYLTNHSQRNRGKQFDNDDVFVKMFSNPKTLTKYLDSLYPNGGGWSAVGDNKHIPKELRRYVAEFDIDRAVSHELVRHQTLDFLQESQRYCAYTDGHRFIDQSWATENTGKQQLKVEKLLADSAENSVTIYNRLLGTLMKDVGMTRTKAAQIARVTLPNMTSTKVIVAGAYGGWQHFFNMRDSAAAYPPMRFAAKDLREQFRDMGVSI